MRSTNAELYGRSVFTTVAFIDATPFLWEKHLLRLRLHAGIVGIDVSDFDERGLLDEVIEQAARAGESCGRARITIFDERAARLWSDPNGRQTSVEILSAPRRPTPALSLAVSPFPVNRRSPLAGIKTGNYLEQILCLEEASERGFDEAIRLNHDGVVVSACMANLFWSAGRELVTPRLGSGCLAGTTREYVLENVNCAEADATLDDLRSADSVYLTSAGRGIARVGTFLGRELSLHPALEALRTQARI